MITIVLLLFITISHILHIFLFLIILGDFLHRNGNTDNQTSTQANLEYQKDDYKALLNKLICPSCKCEQSFEEFYEKIRNCRRCNEKYTKAKISCSVSFERKNKENEEKRLMKLKSLENSVYGNIGGKILIF